MGRGPCRHTHQRTSIAPLPQRAAFPAWAALAASERGRLLYKLVEKLETCCDELAELESIDTARRAQEIRWIAGSELSNALQNDLGVQFPSARRDREE